MTEIKYHGNYAELVKHTGDVDDPATGDLRILMVSDLGGGMMPYDDGMAPIVELPERSVWGGVSGRARQVEDVTSYKLDASILGAVDQWADRDNFGDLIERYLRLFHKATTVEFLRSRTYQGDATYMACDPADWRKAMGLTGPLPEGYELGTDEWQAYLDGDVWGIVVERYTEWTSDTGDVVHEWDHVESVWGYFGHKWAREAAEETAGHYVEEGVPA